MTSKYLISDPIDWLLEEENPSIRYLTKKDILDEESSDADYDEILNSKAIKKLISDKKGEFLGDINKFDLFYKGSMWALAEGVERGLNIKSDIIANTIEMVSKKSQLDSGGFSINWNPRIELPCMTGDMIRTFIKAGNRSNKVENGINWIVKHQREDGGWLHCPLANFCDSFKLMIMNRPGNGLKRENNPDVKSCYYATISCSMALLEYNKIEKKYNKEIKKGATFFLKNKVYLNHKNNPLKPEKYWNRDFRDLGYPVMSQFDILYCLIFLAKAGYIDDPRTGEAFNLVISKQNSNGRWNIENNGMGMLLSDNKKFKLKKENKWVTLNVLRMLKHI